MASRPRANADRGGDARAIDVRSELSPAARRRGLVVLLVATFLTWGGFFVVVPLIAVHYVDGLGWAASSVGLVLAVRQFTQQGSTTLSGALADRLGAKGLICAGMLVRALGFAIMARADTFAILMLSALEGAELDRSVAVTGVIIGDDLPSDNRNEMSTDAV